MNNRNGHSFQVKDFFLETREIFKFRSVLKNVGFSEKISLPVEGKNFTAFQIFEKKDFSRLESLTSKEKIDFFSKKIKGSEAFLIISDGISGDPVLEKLAGEKKIALFSSPFSKKHCRVRLVQYFKQPHLGQKILSGGLVRMFGLGVLIRGDSGVGKSESALELISRGHCFVSDDVTEFKKKGESVLMGSSPLTGKNFMEIRGLGIINIKEIFGNKIICEKSRVDLIIELKKWKEGKVYDRLGLKIPDDQKILGVNIPRIVIPVAPGRNMATLIEVACKVHLLRKKGYHAPEELIKRLDRALLNQKI
jgi:HPr kinase/phosphorylase